MFFNFIRILLMRYLFSNQIPNSTKISSNFNLCSKYHRNCYCIKALSFFDIVSEIIKQIKLNYVMYFHGFSISSRSLKFVSQSILHHHQEEDISIFVFNNSSICSDNNHSCIWNYISFTQGVHEPNRTEY